MDQYRMCAMESPLSRGFSRKPFGELTNNGWSSCTNLSTPVKELTTTSPQEEALTPMANLKMLIRVASETDQLPSKRELFRELESENRVTEDDNELPADLSMKTATLLRREKSTSLDHDYWTTPISSTCNIQQENVTPSPSATLNTTLGPPKVSRKQKSLGLLCEKFINLYPIAVPEGEKCEIPLDELANSMSTERRRIYDIVNVLEAVQMMTKVGKNLYQWHGTTHWLTTLAGLRQLALRFNMLERYNEVKTLEENDPAGCGNYSVSPPIGGGTPKGISPFTPTYSPCSSSSGPSPSPAERKTSLGFACQKFLMLFLIAPEPSAKINLEFAAKVIHGPVLPDAVMKTRIRRLYDIANILQSLKLIRKVQVTETNGGKKPAFEYTGPNVRSMEVTNEILQTLPSTRQRNSLFAVGTNLNIPDEDPKLVNNKESNPSQIYKKRFSISSYNDDHEFEPRQNEERENKIPRTASMKENSFLARSVPMECDDATPQNLTTNRRASNSLMDLSFACEKERHQLNQPRHIPVTPTSSFSSLSSSFSFSSNSVSSSNSSLNGASLPFVTRSISFPTSQQNVVVSKKPLSSANNSNVKLVHVGSNNSVSGNLASANRWVGFGRSKTVIALVSPTNNSSNCYPAVQTSPVSLVMKKTASFN